jgi:predicted nucleic acid-binding protein
VIVTDTNTIAYLYLPSDYCDDVETLLTKDADWIAPLLWRSELRNILALYMRNGLISFGDAVDVQQQAEVLMDGNEYEISSLEVLQIANDSGSSAYDSEFVCLAKNTESKLITADKKILKAFPEIAFTVKDFLASEY